MGKRKAINIIKKEALLAVKIRPKKQQQGKDKKTVKETGAAGYTSVHDKQPEGNPGSTKHAAQPWTCHSVVDRQAAKALRRLLSANTAGHRGATVKSLTLAADIQAKKATYAVTCEALKHLPVLERVVEETGILSLHERLAKEEAYVLCYEVLFGEGVRPHGPAERAILKQREALQAAFNTLEQNEGLAGRLLGLLPCNDVPLHARTARVNELKLTVEEALHQLRASIRGAEAALDVRVDDLLPDVLVFPPGTDLHDHHLVTSGALVLQSKASCMPAHALQPQADWIVLDACAAPGNKTTHVAALMRNRGRVLAFDRDPVRLKRLEANAVLTGANIQASCQDFLQADITSGKLMNVQGVILDPSCSGSGTVYSSLDYLLPEGDKEGSKGAARIAALADFQRRAILHAFQLPRLQRLVYSTCSVHAEENELVVAAVLEEAQQKGFELVDPFPTWSRRGLPLVAGAELLVRTDPLKDGTDGFFVAVFQKCASGQRQ